VLVALLAIATELIFGLAARVSTPRTASRGKEPVSEHAEEPA
jgi:hypothetical protein